MENSMEYRELFQKALIAAEKAYAPYSLFRVGAALLIDDGSVVTGVNVENRSFGLTNCAERSAVFTAVSSGKRFFSAIAIATPDSDYPVSPCGACRQLLAEYAPRALVWVADSKNLKIVRENPIKKLLPAAFVVVPD